MTSLRFRMLVPVAALATGACFATTKDVVQLQSDITSARRDQEQRVTRVEQQLTRMEQQQAARMDTLARLLKASVDSLRLFGDRFSNTGGNIAADTRGVEAKVNTVLARLEALLVEQENQAKELKLLGEQMRGVNAALAADTARTDVVEGPLAKLATARRQIDRSPATAREYAEGVLAATPPPDSSIMAEAYEFIAQTYRQESRQEQADSVFRIVFEKFPRHESAPNSMYMVALSLEGQKKYSEARALYQKVVANYPSSLAKGMADERIRNLPPPLR